MDVQIFTFVTEPLQTNTYVVRCGHACAVVDPGMSPSEVLKFLSKGAAPSIILLTHGHGDHIAGVGDIKSAYPQARLLCPAADAPMLADAQLNLSAPFGMTLISPPADELLQPGGTLSIGESLWQVLDTSGHTPGGVSYYCPAVGVVLTGDALFASSVGRTDIPNASEFILLRNIRDHLMNLPDDTRAMPGHGPETTIGRERRGNPFLLAM